MKLFNMDKTIDIINPIYVQYLESVIEALEDENQMLRIAKLAYEERQQNDFINNRNKDD